MREEDEIRAAVIALAEAQAAGEDIADALPHGEAWAAMAAASDEVGGKTPSIPGRRVRRPSRRCLMRRARPREQAACRVPANGRLRALCPRRRPKTWRWQSTMRLWEFGDPNGSRDAGDVEGPDAGAAPRRAANKHVKSAFSSSNGRPVGASPFKRKPSQRMRQRLGRSDRRRRSRAEAECVDRASSATEEDVRGAGGCP